MVDVSETTIRFLRKNAVPFDEIIFRDIPNIDDGAWKAEQLRHILRDGSKAEIYEDKLDNIQYFKLQLAGRSVSYFLVGKKGIEAV